jgi:hypothetical protein
MSIGPNFIRWLGAAILLIAAYAMPSAAQAHAGHPVLSVHQNIDISVQMSNAEARPAVSVAARTEFPDTQRDCDCLLCTSTLACCCSMVMASPEMILERSSSLRDRMPISQWRQPESKTAEALPEPPRPFA